MLVSEFITTLQREASEAQDDTGFNNLVLSWVKDAITEFCNETEWKYFQNTSILTTTATVRTYALPLYANDIRGIEYPNNGGKLDYVPFASLQGSNSSIIGTTGRPTHWYLEGIDDDQVVLTEKSIQIGLFPVPNSTINFVVFQENDPSALLLTDLMPVTNQAILALKHRVRYYFAMNDKDAASARMHDRLYEKEKENLQYKEHKKTDSRMQMKENDVSRRSRGRFWRDPNHFHN